MNKQSGGAVARGTLGSPEFLQPLVDREFPIGEPAVLEVRIAGSAPLTVQWYHNSQPVRESIEKDIRLLQKGTIEFHLSSTRDSRTGGRHAKYRNFYYSITDVSFGQLSGEGHKLNLEQTI